jgi:hypothetical protein
MWPFRRKRCLAASVLVTMIDASNESELALAELLLDDLPDSFAPATTLHVGDDEWSILTAEPPTKKEFCETRQLRLRLRRVPHVDPPEVRGSPPGRA